MKITFGFTITGRTKNVEAVKKRIIEIAAEEEEVTVFSIKNSKYN
jgi:hypothetical protein